MKRTIVLPTILIWFSALAISAQENPAPNQANSQTSETTTLEPGKTLERQLTRGESHSYALVVQSGQFLQVVLDQQGIDVVLNLYNPTGEKLSEIDSPNGPQGPEELQIVAAQSGTFRLEVRSLEANAAPGRYKIGLKELRKSTAQDYVSVEKLAAKHEADRLQAQVSVLLRERQNKQALELVDRVVELRVKVSGEEDPVVIELFVQTGQLYSRLGIYIRAEEFFKRALSAIERVKGPEHHDCVRPLVFLSFMYETRGDTSRAEAALERAVKITEAAFTPETPNILLAFDIAAYFYDRNGKLSRAEKLLERSLQIREKTYGSEHVYVAATLMELASLYEMEGKYGEAERLLKRALAIRQNAKASQNADVTNALVRLGRFYTRRGNYVEAESMFKMAAALDQKSFGSESNETLQAWAVFHLKQQHYDKAEELSKRVLAELERTAGSDHPLTIETLSELERLYRSKNEVAAALQLQRRINEAQEKILALMLATGSEEQKRRYMTTLAGETARTVSLNIQHAPHNKDAIDLALTTILRRKGRVLDAMADQLSGLRRNLSAGDQTLLDRLTSYQSRLAELTFQSSRNSPQVSAAKAKLTEQIEIAEAQIAKRSVQFAVESQPVVIENLKPLIPSDAVLIEFFKYRPLNVDRSGNSDWGAMRYAAYAVRSSGEPVGFDIGGSEDIDARIRKFRKALANPKETDFRTLSKALYVKLIGPVLESVGNVQHLLISPDGALNLIPFSALLDANGRFLIKTHQVSYLTSGRDLLRLRVQTRSRQEPVIVGDPTFDKVRAAGNTRVKLNGRRSINFTNLSVPPLPGTAAEVASLKRTIGQALVLTKEDATEAALKKLAGPRLLHIATHGFFLTDQTHNESDRARQLVRLGNQTSEPGENPLLRSGILLAGVMMGESGAGEDGILTALETAGLDLWGTKLVVLSACDTGLGDARNGEGVYGLRRALTLAGTDSQITTLWKVDDIATRDLMISFYKRLQQGEARGEALRNTQLGMLKSSRRNHPYYWASFIQGGNWKKL